MTLPSIRGALIALDAAAEAKRDDAWQAQDRWLPDIVDPHTPHCWKHEAEEAWLHLAGANEELGALQSEIRTLRAEQADAKKLARHLRSRLDDSYLREAGLRCFVEGLKVGEIEVFE